MTDESTHNSSKLKEMVIRGTNFKEDYTFEMYGGEEVTVILQPLVDDEFLPIAAFLSEHLDVEEEEFEREEAVSEAIDKVEEAEEDDGVDISKLNEEFVGIMQQAAIYGIYGAYDADGNEVEHSNEEIESMVSDMMGGYSVEIGSRVLELSGDVRDAEKFRGGRGSVSSSRSE